MICFFGLTLATAVPAQQAALPEPVVLPAPLLEMGGPTSGSVGLTLLSAKPNQVTDEEQWWQRNDLRKPELYLKFPAGERGTIPEGAPVAYRGQQLLTACQGSQRRFFVYGESIYKARYLLIEAADGHSIEFAFDAKTFGTVDWAEVADGVLYLTNTPGNLSADQGAGARLYAIDLATNTIRWMTRKKVAHGQFILAGWSVICSYGFTGEPDFIHVLSRTTGEIEQTLKLKTAADWLIRKDDKLHVRCYDEDRVYRIQVLD